MMHGHEKSDSVIVAVKPANKAVHPAAEQSAAEAFAAEPGEPRAETKGNADQQTMPWAQSQTSMPRALDRIREVARERKKGKFISLFHHISIDLLAGGVLPTRGGRGTGSGPADVEGLRGRARAQSRRFAQPGPKWSVSGAAKPAGGHPPARRAGTPAP